MSYYDHLTDILRQHESQDSTARMADEDLCLLHRGKGSVLWDHHGKEYWDFCASFASLPLGHHHPQVMEGVARYLASEALVQGMGDVYASCAKAELTEALVDFLPSSMTKVAYALSGSDAVELSLKTAMLTTGKPGVLAFSESYHGLHLGSMAVSGMERFRSVFPGVWQRHPAVWHIPYTTCISEIVKMIRKSLNTRAPIGQMIIEPILGRFGVFPLEETYVQDLYEALQDLGCLLIFDEVYTGFGRAGCRTFVHQWPADMVCLGKALGGGMPVSCVAGSADIMDSWPENRGEALHTGTFFGHPLSCEVARLTLKILMRENLVQRSATLGGEMKSWLQTHLLPEPSLVKAVRGCGLMLALDTGKAKGGVELCQRLKQAGMIAVPSGLHGECVTLTPALNMPSKMIWQGLECLLSCIQDVSVL